MAYLNAFIEELQTVTASVWPVSSTGAWEDTQIEDVPFGDLTNPYAAILVNGTDEAEWGADAQTYETLVEFWLFVAEQGEAYPTTYGAATVRPLLEQLRDYLWNNDLTTGQMLVIERVDWSTRLAPNVYFKSMEKPFIAGMIAGRFVVGESPAS